MRSWTSPLPFFPAHELACKGSGEILLDIHFAVALPALRMEWGGPLTPTSVCRTPAHNKNVGGHPRSMHLTVNPARKTAGCMAADIAWRDWKSETQLRFAKLARKMGWSVGLHDGFCHIDRRADIGMAKNVFLYGTWSGAFTVDDVTG